MDVGKKWAGHGHPKLPIPKYIDSMGLDVDAYNALLRTGTHYQAYLYGAGVQAAGPVHPPPGGPSARVQ